MKKIVLFLIAIVFAVSTFAQAPQAFKFQTVVRDGNGEVLPLQDITLKFQIRIGSPEGDIAYSEQHFVTTNALGLVSLNIGGGEPINGTFGSISWGDGSYFLEELIDIGNTGDFQVFGTVQLLSVPYALHANTAGNGIQSMSTEERDALENPAVGTQIYNTTTNCLNYWSGSNWFETCGDCTPQPDNANAGPDQTFYDSTTFAQLEANDPEFGQGEWTKLGSFEGYFDDPADPNTQFHGEPCKVYYLQWTISTGCGSNTDNVKVTFGDTPSQAIAGEDILINSDETTVTLNAVIPENGEGLWSVISGEGGIFDDAANPLAQFTGLECEAYLLHWQVSTPCYTSVDSVYITFFETPTIANAGEDQFDLSGTWTILGANTPTQGEGHWTILSGDSGFVVDPQSPTSIFLGKTQEYYKLEWQIATSCDTSVDQLYISFGIRPFLCGDTIFDHRDDQTYSTIQIGEQCWMAENLNIGERIDGGVHMTDNGIIEKYCFENDPLNCDSFGGLYNWWEAMNYETFEGSTGICPDGWYIPTDQEWKILEGFTDSLYGIGDPEWDKLVTWCGRGYNAGKNLKSIGFQNGTNKYGFNAKPAGRYLVSSGFYSNYDTTAFWSSTNGLGRGLWGNCNGVDRYSLLSRMISLRCIKNPGVNIPPKTVTNIYPGNNSINIALDTFLQWSCSDPDGDPLIYDVYFGTEITPPQVATTLADTFYTPGTLEYATTYYWKIIAHDDHGNTTEGEVWSFTTLDDPFVRKIKDPHTVIYK